MKTKTIKKRVIVILTFICITMILVPASSASAIDKPGVPLVTVKMVNDTDVKITIGKTSNVDYYEVWVTSDCGYKGFKNNNYYHSYYYNGDDTGNYINAATVYKNGTATRSVVLKNLTKGKVSVIVRGCNSWYIGDFSKKKTVNVKSSKKGYRSSYDFSKVKSGDIIKFGSYEQDYPINGKDPIEWVVLEKKKNGLLVMSKYALDCLPYNNEWIDITWEDCTLRTWLNKKFYNAAFNGTEKKMIKSMSVDNEDNPYYGTEGGRDTIDKVFLLSISEVTDTRYGFDADTNALSNNRRCVPTAYAVAQGVYHIGDIGVDNAIDNSVETCWWLLRSAGAVRNRAAHVGTDGSVDSNGYGVDDFYGDAAVRPVISISLKSE